MLLNEVEAKSMLKKAGVTVTETRLASSKDEALQISRELGFPIVLKIVSPDVVHKSDSGGVKLNLQTEEEVGRAYDEILGSVKKACPEAKILGVSVQTMAPQGVETIIGVSKDKQFGPVVMFGLGGVWVEVLKDVSFRLAPLSGYDASEMVREIKGYKLLTGFRGQPAVKIPELEKMLLAVSDFVSANPQVNELDLNPVFASADGAVAVDARIVVED
ncbi:MAG: acetate--CoA ligase family protein [Dehalococcoidales bacterium]|nr:acetate--CoA ligase family protein [Dehalococcoidales bacterium]